MKSLRFTTAVVIACSLWSVIGEAQVYVRQSKGAAVRIFTEAAINETTAATGYESATFDWTAFDSAQIQITTTNAANLGGCKYAPTLEVFGGDSPASAIPTLLSRPPGGLTTISTYGQTAYLERRYNYVVSALPAYVSFKLTGTGPRAEYTASNCKITVTVTPLPFSTNQMVQGSLLSDGQFSTTTKLAPVLTGGVFEADGVRTIKMAKFDTDGRQLVSVAGTTTAFPAAAYNDVTTSARQVHAASLSVCQVTVVNRSTVVAYCSQTDALTAATGIPVNAATSNGTAGGSFTFNNYGGDVYCITSSGTATLNVQPVACP